MCRTLGSLTMWPWPLWPQTPVKWASGPSPSGSRGAPGRAECASLRGSMKEGHAPLREVHSLSPTSWWTDAGQVWVGTWRCPGPCLCPCRLQWQPGRRALGWARSCPLSWWSPVRWVLWSAGSCVGPHRVPRGILPGARLLLGSEEPSGMSQSAAGQAPSPPAAHAPPCLPSGLSSSAWCCLV